MTNKRMSTQVIAEILTEEIETLKQTVDEVKQLHKDGLKVDQEPLNDFMNEFRRMSKRKLQLPKWFVVSIIAMAFIAIISIGFAVHFYHVIDDVKIQREETFDLAITWKERAVELGYQITEPKENK